jgi:hypothetical protein
MSALNKFIIYQCDTCNRKTEIQLDGKRPDPVNCNITLKCRGKLKRVGESSSKHFLFTPIVSNLQDYVPRGTKIIPSSVTPNVPEISIFTGSNPGILTITGLRRSQSSVNSFVINELNKGEMVAETQPLEILAPLSSKISLIMYEISSDILQFKKYTFLRQGNVQLIHGSDDSPEGNSLRFTQSNRLQVNVNGVELDPSFFDSSINDQITLTPAIFNSYSLIEILVFNDLSKEINQTKMIRLEFFPLNKNVANNLNYLERCAWGDNQSVKIDDIETFNLYCTDTSKLVQNASYGIDSIELTDNLNSIRTIEPSQVKLLLGSRPYSFEDKELFGFVSGSTLTDKTVALSYKQNKESGEFELLISSDHITQTIHQITPTNKLVINSAVVNIEITTSMNLVHRYILGPV